MASPSPDSLAVSPTGSGLLVIVPTYNEATGIGDLLQELFGHFPDCHCLVVDDSSPDGTAQRVKELQERYRGKLFLLQRPQKAGLGRAYIAGFQWGLGKAYGAMCEMDADLSHHPRYLRQMLQSLAGGAEVVIGSRNVPGGGIVGWGPGRHLLSKGGSWYARNVLGVALSDLTSGYKLYHRRCLERLGLESLRSNGYAFQIETTVAALSAGAKVVEVPIVFEDRRVGESKLSWPVVVEAIWIVWRLRWKGARNQANASSAADT